MSLWRHLAGGLRVIARRGAADRELDEELQHYVEQATDLHIARGLPPDQARRAARLEIGNATIVREQVRDGGWERVAVTTLADLRYAARGLCAAPGFTAVSVVTLALGIGASAAIFSAVKPTLFEPLPYPHADRITMVADVSANGQPLDVTFGTYRELAQRSHGFEAIAPFKPWQPTMIGGGEPERLAGERVGAGFFQALGIAPAIGRDFVADEDRPNGPNVVILSDALWRRHFRADPAIVGRQITLDEAEYLVAGVLPRGFENVLAPAAEIWTPLQYNTVFGPDTKEWGHHLRALARLRAGVSLEAARRELNQIAHAPVAEFPRVPWANLQNGLLVTSLQDDVAGPVKPALLAVIGAVLVVLAIACVNVTGLLLARGARRRGELAMRAALGAGRGRLIRQLLTESLLLAVVGGALGLIVAGAGVRALVALSPPELPRVAAIRLDRTVLLFTTLLTTLLGIVVGLIPAAQISGRGLQIGLQDAGRRSAGGHQRTRALLVVAQIALAIVLLVSAGLLLRSIERVFAVPVGFDASRLLTMQVQESGRRFQTDGARSRFYNAALDAAREVPGVSAAAFTALLPLSGETDSYGVHFESDRGIRDDGAALRYAVTPGYFEAMRIPLRRGRLFDARDRAGAPRAVVINESFARRSFGQRDPIGQRLRFGPEEGDWYTVVGIVGDVRQSSFDVDQPDAIYVPAEQWHWVDALMSLVVRARGDAASLTPAIRRAIWSVDKDQPIVRIATMSALVDRSVADRRFALTLFEAFGLAALLLAATGIYGVLAGSVAERTREIGVRSALGASRRDIVSLVVRQAMTFTGIGAAIGLAAAVAVSRALVTLLFGISPLDPLTYLGVVALLLSASAIACAVPAWRAARIDPAVTLRAE